MSEEKLIWGAGFIDDDLVCEAIDYKPRRIRLAPWACAAAAAVVTVTAVAVLARQIGSTPVIPPDPAYTGNSENTASGSSSIPYSTNSSYSEDISSVSSSDPEPQPVDIGNGMTLTGTPLDSSELEEFSIEPYIGSDYLAAEDTAFLDSLEVPELEDLYKRALRLTWCSLSPCDVRFAPAVSANDRKVPYIEEKDDDGWSFRYCETGYTYESFYNEYLKAFTKETIDEMFNEYDVFLNYNGELFCSDAARGGWLDEVHREFELFSKSDTVIEFRRLTFHSDSDGKPSTEYIPEYRDEYEIGDTRFKFVLTEDGWRAASIPVEYITLPKEKDDPVTPFTPPDGIQVYADIFEEFIPENPTSYGPPLTLDEEMDMLIPKSYYPPGYDVDSFYLVEVIRALTNEEYMQMKGWEEDSGDGDTIYEVKLVEDLISGEAPDRTEFIRVHAGYGARIQKIHDPAYAPGERFTAVLSKPYEGRDFVISVRDYTFRYDLPQMSFTENDEETMLYFRGNGFARQPVPVPFETEEISITAAYSTPQNPATYIQKIALNDLVEFLRSEWDKRGISYHFETQPMPPIID